MVIRGRTRGNGKQLASYLLSMKENETVHILDVDGLDHANDNDLHSTLLGMSLTSELTKSHKGLYHVVINPAYGDDRLMTPEDWRKAADIIAKHTRFEHQRRVIVLHQKKGRTHAHVVFERYDHSKGVMISDSWNYRGQDKARFEMEKVFEHTPTPHKNVKRPQARKDLTELWRRCASGKEFIQEARAKGYIIAKGEARRPFMVIDNTGRSFDLVRELQGVRTKEVKERLQGIKLRTDKVEIEAIRFAERTKESGKTKTAGEFAKNKDEVLSKPVKSIEIPGPKKRADTKTNDQQRFKEAAKTFTENKGSALSAPGKAEEDPLKALAEKLQAKIDQERSDQERFKNAAKGFADNRNDQLQPQNLESEMDRFRRELMEKLDQMRKEQKDKEKGKDMDGPDL